MISYLQKLMECPFCKTEVVFDKRIFNCDWTITTTCIAPWMESEESFIAEIKYSSNDDKITYFILREGNFPIPCKNFEELLETMGWCYKCSRK